MPATETLFVTGATGQLGGLVIEMLLAKVPASAIIAGARDPAKNAAVSIRDKGVEVRVADYARPETLDTALAGVDRLLLISGSEMGKRREQHRNVIAAAKRAGVGFIAYTSIIHADTSPLFLAEEHRDTEAALAGSGVPFALLRNSWYTENFLPRVSPALDRGVLDGAAGEGRVSAAARTDYAEAAACVLTGDGHAGRIYELAGDGSFTLADLARVAGEAAKRSVSYRNMAPDTYEAAAIEAGVPERFAHLLAETDAGTAQGALFDDSGTLGRLIGRSTTPFDVIITSFVQTRPPQV